MGRSCTLLRTVESWARGGCPECPEFYDSDDDDDDKENDDPESIVCLMCGETAMDGAAVRPVPNHARRTMAMRMTRLFWHCADSGGDHPIKPARPNQADCQADYHQTLLLSVAQSNHVSVRFGSCCGVRTLVNHCTVAVRQGGWHLHAMLGADVDNAQ